VITFDFVTFFLQWTCFSIFDFDNFLYTCRLFVHTHFISVPLKADSANVNCCTDRLSSVAGILHGRAKEIPSLELIAEQMGTGALCTLR